MKRTFIFSAGLLCSLYVLLGSNAAGPASSGNGIRNGGPGSNGTCASCHGGGAGTTTMTISLKEKVSGTAANGSYKPGMVYTVSIGGNNTNLAFFGFQLSATTAAHLQAGAFSNMGGDKHVTTISGIQLAEHSTSLAKTNGAYEASFDWTAPAAGAGTVTFDGIINGVNHTGDVGGDKTSAPVRLSFTENSGGTAINELEDRKMLRVYPNPATDVLYVRFDAQITGRYALAVYDLQGKVLWSRSAQSAATAVAVPVQALASGTYFLRVSGNGQSSSRMFQRR